MRSPARCGFYDEVGEVDEKRLAALIPKGEVRADGQLACSLRNFSARVTFGVVAVNSVIV